jgi:hypothetical protein
MATINLGKIKPLWRGDYSAGATYRPLDFVNYNNETYINTLESTGNLPTNETYFEKIVQLVGTVQTTGNQTVAGVKTFSSNPISTATQSTEGNSLARRDFVTGLDGQNVKLTGNQTITGTKTFNGTINGTAVTQSTTDTTAGRLLKVGDFGLGNPTDIPVNDANDLDVNGLFRCNSTANTPFPNSPGGLLLHQEWDIGAAVQTFWWYNPSVGAPIMYNRSRVVTTWGPWRSVYDTGNILGTVSQSSGVPTGAIIQRGSNANGEFVKYADGTMICHHNISFTTTTSSALGRRSGYVLWNFPVGFVNSEYTAFGTASNSPGEFFCIPADAGTPAYTNLRMYMLDSGVDGSRALKVKAIGRWY